MGPAAAECMVHDADQNMEIDWCSKWNGNPIINSGAQRILIPLIRNLYGWIQAPNNGPARSGRIESAIVYFHSFNAHNDKSFIASGAYGVIAGRSILSKRAE